MINRVTLASDRVSDHAAGCQGAAGKLSEWCRSAALDLNFCQCESQQMKSGSAHPTKIVSVWLWFDNGWYHLVYWVSDLKCWSFCVCSISHYTFQQFFERPAGHYKQRKRVGPAMGIKYKHSDPQSWISLSSPCIVKLGGRLKALASHSWKKLKAQSVFWNPFVQHTQSDISKNWCVACGIHAKLLRLYGFVPLQKHRDSPLRRQTPHKHVFLWTILGVPACVCVCVSACPRPLPL